MDLSAPEILRLLLAFVALGALLGTAWIVHRRYVAVEYRIPARLFRMMGRLGLAASDVEAPEHRVHLSTAVRLCEGCASKRDCDAWLGDRRAAAGPPAFCHNAQFLTLLGDHRARSAISP